MEYSAFIKRYGVGLTGNIATGKSTVAKMIQELGHVVIDADQLSRLAVAPKSPGLAKIVERFGAAVLLDDNTLDRKKLAGIIFDDPQKKKALEQIVHPAIHEMLNQRLLDLGLLSKNRLWFYEASLLVETGAYHKFRALWCTYCSEKEQLRRLTQRDKIDTAYAQKIMANQMPSKQKMQAADICFNTEVPLPELNQKVKAAVQDLQVEIKSQFVRL